MVLVGREEDIRQVTALLADPPQMPGQLRFVQIDGEIGAGKSALLSSVLRELREKERAKSAATGDGVTPARAVSLSTCVLLAQGDQLHTDGPLVAFRVLLEGLLGEPVEELLDDATPAQLALRCLEALDDTPVVIAVDDAHWLDPASVTFLDALMQSPAHGPLTVIVVHRFGQAPWNLIMAARKRGALMSHYTLEPLPDTAISAIADSLSAPQVEAVVAAAEGNPLFAHALIAAFRRHPDTARVEDVLAHTGAERSSLLAAAVASDLDRLDTPARLTLESLAILGRSDTEALAEVAGLDQRQVTESAKQLAERGLLTENPHEVLHPVVRLSVYQNTSTARRSDAHRRAAYLPETELFERAEHLRGALTSGNLLTGATQPLTPAEIAVLVDAAGVAIGSEPAAVLRWLSDLPPELRTPQTETLLARALILTGDFETAIDRLRAIISTTDAPEAQILLANALRVTGHTGEARALLETAQDGAGSADPALLREYIDMVSLIDGHPPEVLISKLESLHDPAGTGLNKVVAAIYRTMASLAVGRVPEGQASFRRVTDWADRVTNDELASVPHAAACAVWAAYMLDQYQAGLVLAKRSLQLAHRHGQADVLANLGTGLAFCQAAMGLLDDAERTGTQAVHDAETYGPPSLVSMARAGLMIAAQGRNNPELLRARYEDVMAVPLPEFGWWRNAVLTTRGRVAAMLDEPLEAHPELLGDPKDAMIAARYADAAVVAASTGDHETANALIAQGLEIAEEQKQHGQRGMVLTTQAELLLRAGDPLSAVNLFREARTIFEQRGMKLLIGRAQAGMAQAEAALSKQAAPLAQLSEREQQVAELLAQGMKNREIAAHLGVSARTAENHVHRLLKKLDLSSRSEVAQLLSSPA